MEHVLRVPAGDTAVGEVDREYADLFTAHGRAVFRLAALLCADAYVAEEIAAEVFARVLPRWRRGGVADPLMYLRRATVNEVRSRFRRRGSEVRALERVRRLVVTASESERVDLREPLMLALRRLPVRQRAVVVLRFYDDLSEADVANTLGIAVGTVKSHASQGLTRLRELMKEDQ
jgi:RNA polymerase sigma-70 factor (sigma-E family)